MTDHRNGYLFVNFVTSVLCVKTPPRTCSAEFNEMITKDHATAAKEAIFPELEVPCSSAGMQWLTPTHSYSVTKQSTRGLTAHRKRHRKRTWAHRQAALGPTRKEKNTRALVLLPLGNSFLFVDKLVLNGEAAPKEQRKVPTGFLQASQEQHIWEQSCSPYGPPTEHHHLFNA